MFTSVTASKPTEKQKLILYDLSAALLCILFGAVYERFSHGVYSYGMIYAFVFPLVLGVLPLFLIEAFSAPYPPRFCRSVYHAGIAALTVGSIVSGVLEIYGTTSPLVTVYWVLGAALTMFAAVPYCSHLIRKRITD